MDGRISPNIQDNFWLKFTDWCHQAVVEGYHKMIQNPQDFKEWEEEDISAALYLELEELPLLKSKQISIVPEFRLYKMAIKTGKLKAKNADRIDFRFTKWKLSDEIKYFGEAKNLSHKSWQKLVGSRVSASQYRARYLVTGIDKLVSGAYSVVNGFLIGFVVNGAASDNLRSLNALIDKRKLTPSIGRIESQHIICGYPACYVSENEKMGKILKLEHIFLEFDVVSSRIGSN